MKLLKKLFIMPMVAMMLMTTPMSNLLAAEDMVRLRSEDIVNEGGSTKSGYNVVEMFSKIDSFVLDKDGKQIGELEKLHNIPRDSNIMLNIDYIIPAEVGGQPVVVPNVEYPFHLPKQLKVTQDFTLDIKDDKNNVIATVAVDKETKDANLVFEQIAADEGFLDELTLGEFHIVCQLDTDNIGNDGEDTIDFAEVNGGVGPKIEMNLAIDPSNIDTTFLKANTATAEDLKKNEIPWEITTTFNPETSATLIKGLVIQDTLDSALSLKEDSTNLVNTFTIASTTLGELAYGTDYTYVYDATKHTFIITLLDAERLEVSATTTLIVSYVTTFENNVFEQVEKKEFQNTVSGTYTYKGSEKVKDKEGKIQVHNEASDMLKKDIAATTAKKEVARIYIDKSGVLASDMTKISWTVKINTNEIAMTDSKITDVMPDGLSLDTITIQLNGSTITVDGTTVTYDATTRTLSIAFDKDDSNFDSTKAYTLTYDTKVDSDYFDKNTSPNAINNIQYTGKGFDPGIHKQASVAVNSTLIDKASSYNTSDHTITWTIDVDGSELGLQGNTGDGFYTITDEIVDGLSLLTQDKVFAASDIEVQNKTTDKKEVLDIKYENKKLTIKVPDNKKAHYKLIYKTAVDDPTIYAVNQKTAKFKNIATLHAIVPGAGPNMKDISISQEQATPSDVLQKTFGSYDYNTRKATWTLTINDNKMPISAAKISDKLPKGTKLLTNTIKLMKDGSATSEDVSDQYIYDEASNIIVFELGDIEHKYILTYETECLDSLLNGLDEDGNSVTDLAPIQLINEATIEGSPIPEGGVSVDAKTSSIIQSLLDKQGSWGNNTSYMQWSVLINKNKIQMPEAILEDQILDGLDLNPDSIELYEAVFDGNGNASQGNKVDVNKYTITYDKDKLFTFSFIGAIDNAYLLKFQTDITDVSADRPFSNSISYKGNNQIKPASSGSVSSFAHSSGGSTNVILKDVRLQKSDSEIPTITLAGAELVMERIGSGMSYTASGLTDEHGIAEFKRLRTGKYKVKELTAPENYALPENGYIQANGSDLVCEVTASTPDSGVSFVIGNDIYRGEVSIVKKDIDTDDTLIGAKLQVIRMSDDAVVAEEEVDATGVLNVTDLRYDTYKIKEVEAPTNYVLPTGFLQDKDGNDIEFTLDATHTNITLDVYNESKKGSFQIVKLDKETNDVVAGAIFEVYRTHDDRLFGEAVSNELGIATFANIAYGSYYLKEKQAPTNYQKLEGKILDKDGNEVEVIIDRTDLNTSIDVYNESKKGSVQIVKLDKETNDPLAGAIFEIYRTHDDRLFGEATTNEQGIATFANIAYGSYYLKEKQAPVNYHRQEGKVLDKDGKEIKVIVDIDHVNVTVDVHNESKKGSFQIVKSDKETNDVVAGAIFEVYRTHDDRLFGEAITNEQGIATFADIAYGSYYLKEKQAPTNYQKLEGKIFDKDGNEVEVIIDRTDLNTSIDVYNESKKGSVQIVKLDKETNDPIAGAVFEIYRTHDDRLFGEATTNEQGIATFTTIAYGSYYLKEKQAPINYHKQEGKVLDKDGKVVEVMVGSVNLNISMDVYSESKKGSFQIVKLDQETSKPLAGAIFEVYRTQDNRLFGEAVTNEQGIATFSDIAYGSYYVTEKQAPINYQKQEGRLLDKDGKEIEVRIASDLVSAKDLSFTVTNISYKGSLRILKVDDTDLTPLTGATFAIYNTDEVLVYEKTTDAQGIIDMANLPYGNYFIREIKAPDTYVLEPKITSITVEASAINITIENKKMMSVGTGSSISTMFYLSLGISGGSIMLLLRKKTKKQGNSKT